MTGLGFDGSGRASVVSASRFSVVVVRCDETVVSLIDVLDDVAVVVGNEGS